MLTKLASRNEISTLALLAVVPLALTAIACGTLSRAAVVEVDDTESALERGEYLVTVGGCNDCHTPFVMTERGPEPDPTRRLSGHPESVEMPPPPRLADGPWLWLGGATNTSYAGPWGVTYAANLTPDENTGIGIWTEDMFIQALRTGRHMGVSRPIMPPMPWQNYSRMTDEDLKAIFAYLRSLPPIHNRVPDYLEPSEVAASTE